eukprot:TRINITY_DN61151_c0_g1_i1.p1 TRINITY_DN61151_c0_g1~~TRINITY_DN61151_c0_g1_i1.p1  ORF type:complete len:1088 (-),score=131.03 TRINITY_DN61151_c0_g1_i1:1223-4486(-)
MATSKFFRSKPQHFTPQAEVVPLAVGNNFHDDPLIKRDLKKAQHLTFIQGAPTLVASNPPGYKPPTYKKLDSQADEIASPTATTMMQSPSSAPASLSGEVVTKVGEGVARTAYQPAWLKDAQVLRFRAYFKEAVQESPVENIRVRNCVIYFHTEDDTIVVRDTPTHNSGMTHGVLIKRHRIPTPDEEDFLKLRDLNVGQEVQMYGKVFHIISCAEDTRKYMEHQGIYVPDNEQLPFEQDQFGQLAAVKKQNEFKATKTLPTQAMVLKRHHEYGNTGRISKPTPMQIAEAQQFFNNDGKVVSFSAIWDDRNSVHGDLRQLRLNYYLADDTVELLEPVQKNSGREATSKILLRQKIPKRSRNKAHTNESLLDTLQNDAVQHETFGVKLTGNFLTLKDLGIGKIVHVHGKDLLLYDCNSFTRQLYRDKGMELPESIDISKYYNVSEKKPVVHVPPEWDGLGSEEDSLGNWKSLILKPPKKDYKKWAAFDNKQLRFIMHMVPTDNAVIEEEGRTFQLIFYPEDDSIEIDELGIRNSGIVGGKFLKRQIVKNVKPDGSRVPFKQEDFAIGEFVQIFSRKFEIIAIDNHTQRVIDGVVDPSTVDDIKALIQRLKELLNLKYCRTTEAFRAVAGKCNNHIDLDELMTFFRRMNVDIKRADAKTILNFFDKNQNGTLEYDEFVVLMQGDEFSYNLDESSNSLRGIQLKEKDMFRSDGMVSDHIDDAERQANCNSRQRKLLQMFKDRISQRRIDVVEVFRLMNGMSIDSTMHPEEFKRGVTVTLHMLLSPDDLALLCEAIFPGGKPCSLAAFTSILQDQNEFLDSRKGEHINPAVRTMVKTNNKLQFSGIPIVDSVRKKILERGGRTGFRGLTRVLRFMDDNGNRKLSRRELQSGLNTYGIYPTLQEMAEIMKFFDRDGSGAITVTEFVRALTGDMSPYRVGLVDKAYALLDANCDGKVTLADVAQLYDVSQHPALLSGEKTQQEIYVEFVKAWDKDQNSDITRDEFMDYYTDISAGIDSDEYFELMIRNAWHLSGGKGMSANTTCRRVLVVHTDGSKTVEEIKNDLGIGPENIAAMKRRLQQQGVTDIKSIQLVG